jgi:AcrR family transcriptional regulator
MSSGARRRDAPLDRDRIIDAAMALADRDGLSSVTMRRLADALGVTPMALYKHVRDREELLDGMVDRVVGSIAPPSAGAWAEALRERILAARAAMLRHPWAREAIETRTTASATVLAYMDALMGTMFDGGLSADLVHHGMHALSTRMWGFTRDVLPTPAVPEDPQEREAAMRAFAAAYPSIVRMATTATDAGHACDEDAEFAFALDILLDALERLHADGWTPR